MNTEKTIVALESLADSLGYDIVKRKELIINSTPEYSWHTLLLGKNREEKGHTVRYSQLDKIFEFFKQPYRCKLYDQVQIITDKNEKMIFKLNKNQKAYCGTTSGALLINDRSGIRVISIKQITPDTNKSLF